MRRSVKSAKAILFLCLFLLAAGCARQPEQGQSPLPSATPKPSDYLSIDPDPPPVRQKITLYYKNRDSGFLSPVTRNIYIDETRFYGQVMEELLKGPQGTDVQTVVGLIPTATKLINVTMMDNIAYVNVSADIITADLPLQALWGDDYAGQDQAQLEHRTRELMLYSIVNTMTELPGVAGVKILIDNKTATYADLGLDAWTIIDEEGLMPDTPLPVCSRSPGYIMQPEDVVQILMDEWKGETRWEKVYRFLYPQMLNNTALPGLSEMQRQWPEVNRAVTLTPGSIQTQEIRGDNTALVSVSYKIERASGEIDEYNREYLHLIFHGGVWKLIMPPHMLDEEYVY